MSNSWSVSELNHYIHNKLESDAYLANVTLEGEISNFTAHQKGHWYFTVKDDKSRIAGVMFASNALKNTYRPKNGAKVVIKGHVTVYEAGGSYQIYATHIEEAGIGDLYIELERRKKALLEKGYCDPAHKKPIPSYPLDIAVICGKDTAALQDVRTTLQRRWPIAKLTEYYCLVQGAQAQHEITETLQYADTQNHDVILLVRGGGSLEDLWAFNESKVILAVYHANTPIITGVGHEVDTTLVDFVSDLRAPTPTGAAEMATPNQADVKDMLNSYQNRMMQIVQRKFDNQSQRLINIDARLSNFAKMAVKKRETLANYQVRMKQAACNRVQMQKLHLQHDKQRIIKITQQNLEKEKMRYGSVLKLMDAYSPLQVLKRGYSIASSDGQTIRSINDCEVNDALDVRVSDGTLQCTIVGKEEASWKN